MLDGAGVIALPSKLKAEPRMGFCQVRIQAHRFGEMVSCFGVPPQLDEADAKIHMSCRVGGVQPESIGEIGGGLIVPFFLETNLSKRVERSKSINTIFHGCLELGLGV